jgi:hypothetical protein
VVGGPFANQTIRQELTAQSLQNDEGHDMVRWTGLLGTRLQHKMDGHVLIATVIYLAPTMISNPTPTGRGKHKSSVRAKSL